MKSNTSRKYLGKTLTKIIRGMPKIGLATSTYRTTITSEKLGETSVQHDLPTIWLWVTNGLFRSIFITHKILLPGHIHVYFWDTCVKGQSMRLPWYHQNSRCLDGNHTYVTSENDTNTIEMKDVWHTLITQEARGFQ